MNREQKERFRDQHIGEKYNLVHLLPSLDIPELSGFYLKSFLNASKKYNLQLPDHIITPDSKFCGKCGCVKIPGNNLKMKLDDKERKLIHTCLNCQNTHTFDLETQKKSIEVKEIEKKEFVATWPVKKGNDTNSKIDKKPNAKERSKKRKLNSLSNKLKKKKKDAEIKQSSSLLSLESFMQD